MKCLISKLKPNKCCETSFYVDPFHSLAVTMEMRATRTLLFGGAI